MLIEAALLPRNLLKWRESDTQFYTCVCEYGTCDSILLRFWFRFRNTAQEFVEIPVLNNKDVLNIFWDTVCGKIWTPPPPPPPTWDREQGEG